MPTKKRALNRIEPIKKEDTSFVFLSKIPFFFWHYQVESAYIFFSPLQNKELFLVLNISMSNGTSPNFISF